MVFLPNTYKPIFKIRVKLGTAWEMSVLGQQMIFHCGNKLYRKQNKTRISFVVFFF